MDPLVSRLRGNLERIFAEIEETCVRAGRDPTSVQLVAISKYATAIETRALITALVELGRPAVLGESRVQALAQKLAALSDVATPVRWDFVGTLQRNKARSAVRLAHRIHSLDRRAILEVVHSIGQQEGKVVRGLLQVNVAAEASKQGFDPAEVGEALAHCAELPGLKIEGLMGMAPRGTDHETARGAFRQLADLRAASGFELPELSMGMSGDYRGAILEGATMLRIGSALFRS